MHQAGRFGDRVLKLSKHDGRWVPTTWREARENLRRATMGLIASGVRKGDRIGIVSRTRAEWSDADLAALSAGAVVVGIYPTASAWEQEHVIRHSGCRLIFVENDAILDRILAIRETVGLPERLVIFETARTSLPAAVITFADLKRQGHELDLREPGRFDAVWRAVEPADLATIAYTSGSGDGAQAAGGRRDDRVAGELRRRDPQVVAERPPHEGVARHPAQPQRQQPRRDLRDQPLHPQHRLELPPVRGRERGVAAQGVVASLQAVEHAAQLGAAGEPEVERGADALGCQRQAVPRRVADEEDPVLGRRPQPMGDPVALVAHGIAVEVAGQPHGRLLDVMARIEGADADADLAVRREAPRVSGRHVAAVDPDLEVLVAAVRMHLEPARKRRVRGLKGGSRRVENAAPAQRVDDQRRGQLAAVGSNGAARHALLHLRDLEAGVALLVERRAQLRIVEGRESPRESHPHRRVRRVDYQVAERLPDRCSEAQRRQPLGRRGAGRGLALADLIAIHQQHALAESRQLPRDGEPGEAGAADKHVDVAPEPRPLDPPECPSPRHGGTVLNGSPKPLHSRAVPAIGATLDPALDEAGGKPVEGSGGLLIEVDGQIVPNYAATIKHFDEGDVVSGQVVRIDKDEVLVDIGYKSEGVIPSHELSIRRSVDPSDEVSLGEEVDALVLKKEDDEGRLILSKKRARFEKAWRRIEGAAETGEPVEGTVIEVVKGGLILDLGVRGFLPASLVDIRRVHDLDEFMGQKLECKVIELNRSRNNVVLSRRAVLEEERKEVRQQILDRLQPGQVVEGKISNIVDFGAFVDLEGIDGLIHISGCPGATSTTRPRCSTSGRPCG